MRVEPLIREVAEIVLDHPLPRRRPNVRRSLGTVLRELEWRATEMTPDLLAITSHTELTVSQRQVMARYAHLLRMRSDLRVEFGLAP